MAEKKERSEAQKKVQSFILLISVLGVIIVLLHLVAGKFLYNTTHEFMVKHIGGKHRTPHEDVVLVLIDQNSMIYAEEMGIGRWPWSRFVYGDLLTYMNEVAPPKAVFFDIIFSSRDNSLSDYENDPLFAEAVAQSSNVFHNVFFQQNDETTDILHIPSDISENHSYKILNSEEMDFDFIETYNEVEMPLPCLRAAVDCDVTQGQVGDAKPTAMGIAVALSNPDSDGVYRRANLIHKYEDKYYPSMALSAVTAYQGIPNEIEYIDHNKIKVGEFTVPLGSEGDYLINYHVKERIRDTGYSMSILLESMYAFYDGDAEKVTIKPGDLKDKIVIIGVSAVGGQDLKNTPIHQKTPGPEIHANMISNILQNNHIIRASNLQAIITSLILMILTVFLVVFQQNPLIKIGSNITIYTVFGGLTALVFHFTNFLPQTFFALISGLVATTGSYMFLSITEGAERRKYSKILGNMIDPTIVEEALNDLEGLRKGGEKKITAFFSDVASFSTISEKLTSAELASLLNEYLSAMTIILKNERGTLDKYIGDAIVGIFGAPIEVEMGPERACKASLEMFKRLEELKRKWKLEGAYCPEAREMNFRIGLNTGIAKVGFMGTNELASYTMMGDTVNLAARLEAAGKDYGVNTLVSEYTRAEVGDEFVFRKLDSVRVKGKTEPVLIYELVGYRSELKPAVIESVELYEKGFELYQNRSWTTAARHFKQSVKVSGHLDDKASALLVARCNFYKRKSPPASWDGVFTRTHK